MFLAAFMVYGASLSGRFTNWDDRPLVVENPAIRSLSPANLVQISSSTNRGAYLPVRLFSYAVDHALWGLNPFGFRLTNIVLHALNGFLAYLLVLRLFGSAEAALAAAFFFLLHPVQVESVAWVAGRKELLCGLFLLLSALCFDRRYRLSLFFFVLACLSKASAIVLPFLLAACMLGREGLDWRRLARRLWPFVGLALVVSLLSLAVGASHGVVKTYHGGPAATLLTMTRVVADYIKCIAFPAYLSAKYLVPLVGSLTAVEFLAAVLLIAASALLLCVSRSRMARLGGLWFLIALLPFLNIIPISTLRADRYLYVAVLGAGLVFGACVPPPSCRRGLIAVLRVALLAALVCMAVLSWQRTRVWAGSVPLWRDTVAASPLSPMSHANLGAACLERGRRALAEREFENALACDPNFAIALTNLSVIWWDGGRKSDALRVAKRAVEADPNLADARLNLGRILANMNDLDAAYLQFGEAVRLDPLLAEAYYNMAMIHLMRGRLGMAASNAAKAAELGLRDAEPLLSEIRARLPRHPRPSESR